MPAGSRRTWTARAKRASAGPLAAHGREAPNLQQADSGPLAFPGPIGNRLIASLGTLRASPAGQDRTYSRTCRRLVCEYVRTSCNHSGGCSHVERGPRGCEQRLSRRQQERDLWGAFARCVRRPAARAAQPADGEVTRAVAPGHGGANAARSDADLWGGIERSAKRERGKRRAGFAA